MSIYTDMIAHIEANGIGVRELEASPGNPCCLFGVRNTVTNLAPNESLYHTNDIPELVSVVKKYIPKQTVDFFTLGATKNDSFSDYRWVYIYNDCIIKGDKDHAIRLLEDAEKLRIKNVNLH